MKKILTSVATIVVLSLALSCVIYASSDISVVVNEQRVGFQDQEPVIVGGRTLVPVRGVFESLGFEVEWEPATGTATLTNDGYEIRITIGQSVFYTNGVAFELDVPAQNIGGRTMVPLRFPLESIGLFVIWEEGTRTVIVTPTPWSNDPNWSGRYVIVRVDGAITSIPFRSNTSRLYLSIAPLLDALNLPENYVQFIPNSDGEYALSAGNPPRIFDGVSFPNRPNDLRQHILAELLNIDIVFDMYDRTINITTNSQTGGLSQILPAQFIPEYGWVRMTDEMLRDVERMIGETVISQIAEEGITVVFCPYLSAGNRRFAYDYVNRPYLSLFTHTHRAGTGSNYLARGFYGRLYRPGIISQQGLMPFRVSVPLATNLFYQAQNGLLAPDWTRTIAFRYLDDAKAESQALQDNPLHTDPYRFLGIGRYFCERTGDFFNGNFQLGFYWWRTHTRRGAGYSWSFGRSINNQDTIIDHYRAYRFIEDGYEVIYKDWHGDREEIWRTRLAQNSALYQTGCPYLKGFTSMELKMLD